MALYSHNPDLEDFENDWYPTILLAPLNGKLCVGAQELSKDDRWNQANHGRRGEKKWRSNEDKGRDLNQGRNKPENRTHEYIHWVPRKNGNLGKVLLILSDQQIFLRILGMNTGGPFCLRLGPIKWEIELNKL